MPQLKPKNKPKVIGIVGSRRREDWIAVYDQIQREEVSRQEKVCGENFNLCFAAFEKEYSFGDEIVSGGCPDGADRFAEIIAKNVRCPIKIYYADWTKGYTAGFARNSNIARDCDVLIALPREDRTGGTENTIKKALALGKKVILV